MGVTQRPWRRMLLVAGAVLFGCGGAGNQPDEASCLHTRPCGGDLIGSWRFLGACVADTSVLTAVAQPRCTGTTVSSVGYAVSGTITFNADLTYSAQGWNTMFEQTSTQPEACGSGTSCAARSGTVTASDGSFSNLSCTGLGVCACSESSLQAITESGTYNTRATEVELTSPITLRNRSYCVEGELLHLPVLGVTSTDPAAQTIIIADAVAKRM